MNQSCRYGSVFILLAAGGILARGQELPAPPVPAELPVPVEAAPPPAAPPAPANPQAAAAAPAPQAPADGQPTPAADGEASPDPECKPWTAKVPTPDKFPPLGWTLIPPDGPGYYSLHDVLTGNCRPAPPKYPYLRFGLMAWSFYNADFRYLDDPNNTETDFFDPIKRVRLGDDWLFSTGGEYRYRYNNEVNSRLTGLNNVYDLYRGRVYGDLWYRDRFRVYVEGLYAESLHQDLPPLPVDINRGDLLNLFVDVKLCETCKDHPVFVRVGRQELLYGSERLISPLTWANTLRTFQGAKLFYRGDKWDADLFVVQPVVPSAGDFDSVDNNRIFTGAWVTYRPRKGVWVDAYYLNLDNTNPTTLGQFGAQGGYNVNTVGGRYYSSEKPFMYDLEGMLQFGESVNQHILAKAFTTASATGGKTVRGTRSSGSTTTTPPATRTPGRAARNGHSTSCSHSATTTSVTWTWSAGRTSTT